MTLAWGDQTDTWDLLTPPPWHNQAACQHHPNINWFPDRGADINPAIQICRTECPVRAQCLKHALTHNETSGIWGGHSQNTLTQLRRTTTPRILPGPGNLPAACGTDSGYYRHRAQRTPPCAACITAHAAATRDRYLSPTKRADTEAARRGGRVSAGWCLPCAQSRHTDCKGGCRCTICPPTERPA